MNEPTIRLPRHTCHTRQVIKHCKWLIRHYVKRDAYAEYDWLGAPDTGKHNIITCRQFWAINGRMHAGAPEDFCRCWCDRPLPGLEDIPRSLDLVDCSDSDVVERGFAVIFELVSQMAEMPDVGDVAPIKALHLLRPRFVAISDSRIRKILCIKEEFPGTTKGEKYAARAIAVQRAIRDLGRKNKNALKELQAYVNQLAPEIVSGLLGEGVAASKPSVELSKARVLDIVLWSYAAWGDAG